MKPPLVLKPFSNVIPRSYLLIAVLCVTLAARAGFLLFTPWAFSTDPDGYWRLADNLARTGTLGCADVASAFRPPVYPLLLTPCAMLGNFTTQDVARLCVGVLHIVLGVTTVGLVYVVGIRLGLGAWSAAAAMMVAFDPILLNQSALIMTETTATLLAAAALFAMDAVLRRPGSVRAVLLGLTLAVAALCRPVFLPWLLLAVPFLFFSLSDICINSDARATSRIWNFARKSHFHQSTAVSDINKHNKSLPGGTCAKRLGVVLPAAIAALAVLAIWAVRNQIQFGRPILTTTHGGYTLYLANNLHFYDYLRSAPPGSVWDAQELGPRWHRAAHDLTPETELADDRQAYAAALKTIGNQPGMFLYACLVRVGRLWSVTPHRDSFAWPVAVWYCVEFFLAVVGAWSICRTRSACNSLWLWALALVICVTAVHAVYWTNMRMRAPLEPVIALAAAAGLSSIAARRRCLHWWPSKRISTSNRS